LYYDDLLEAGLLKTLDNTLIIGRKTSDENTKDFVMPIGSSSIVRHFFQKSGVKIEFEKFIECLRVDDGNWSVSTKVGNLNFIIMLSILI